MPDGQEVRGMGDVDFFGDKDNLTPVQQEAFSLGFDLESLNTGRITGLVAGSRAAEEGNLREDDKILWHSRLEACLLDVERKFYLRIERDGGKILDVHYRPRTKETVETWLVVRQRE
jgi:hypothetical protein